MNKNLTQQSKEESHKSALVRLGPLTDPQRPGIKGFCKKLLVHPDSKFKIVWDLIVIVFAVYNAFLIPYEFAYEIDTNIFLEIIDRTIDVIFIIDIFINFRTMYHDSKTDEIVKDSK